MSEIKHVTIVARRWFQQTTGNTYYTALLFIDGQLSVVAGRNYGYGRQYAEDVLKVARREGLLPGERTRELSLLGIAVHEDVVDVARKSDLHDEGAVGQFFVRSDGDWHTFGGTV